MHNLHHWRKLMQIRYQKRSCAKMHKSLVGYMITVIADNDVRTVTFSGSWVWFNHVWNFIFVEVEFEPIHTVKHKIGLICII